MVAANGRQGALVHVHGVPQRERGTHDSAEKGELRGVQAFEEAIDETECAEEVTLVRSRVLCTHKQGFACPQRVHSQLLGGQQRVSAEARHKLVQELTVFGLAEGRARERQEEAEGWWHVCVCVCGGGGGGGGGGCV